VLDFLRVAAACGLGLLLLGTPVSAAPAATGWTEIQTPNVTLMTDLHPEDARRAALAVERTRAALLAAAWPSAKLLQPEHIEVVVYANRLDFQGYFGDRVGAVFMHGAYPPVAFLYGPPEKWEQRATLALTETTSVLKHELMHHLSAFIYRRQPTWFAEGMAQFFETMRVSDDGRTATLGDANLQALASYHHVRSTGVADALAWGGKLDEKDQATTWGLYGVSWLLVHWLYNTHAPDFDRYQTLLVKGIDPDKAWKAAFPGLTPAALDTELHHYAQVGDFRNVSVPVPEVVDSVRERPMTSAEVHATRARTALSAGSMQVHGDAQYATAKVELAAALADDPANVRALAMKMGAVPPAERVALARRATLAHPEDGLAWLMLADALRDSGENWEECIQAYGKATELLPDNATAFNNLAWMQLQKGHAQEALPLAVTAVRIAPWESAFLDTLAAALASLGRCTEAATMQSRALDNLPERSGPTTRARYVERLATLQKHCSGGGASAAAPAASPRPDSKP
jgi:Flp pilus assembly protein TadD